MMARGKEIQQSNKPPTPEMMAAMKSLLEALTSTTLQATIVLAIAVLAMSISRYL